MFLIVDSLSFPAQIVLTASKFKAKFKHQEICLALVFSLALKASFIANLISFPLSDAH